MEEEPKVSAVMILSEEDEPMEGVLESLKPQCDEVIIIRGGSRGWARNEGLKRAKNRYVLMVDSDQILSPNYVQKLLENIKDKGVCGGLVLPHPTLSWLSRLEEYFKAIVSLNIRASGAGGNLYQRDLALKVGGFRLDAGKIYDYDYELFEKINTNYGASFVPEAFLYHLKKYDLRALTEAGLTSFMTKRASLGRLFLRILSSLLRVFQNWKRVYNLSRDKYVFLLPFYSVFRQLLFFLCACVRRLK